jgi:divalent metal cation (Fe/Co/Zn/Cd) transporter
MVNSVGLTMSLLSGHVKWWMDPVGAVIVALLILRSWTTTAYGNYHFISIGDFNCAFLFKLTVTFFF